MTDQLRCAHQCQYTEAGHIEYAKTIGHPFRAATPSPNTLDETQLWRHAKNCTFERGETGEHDCSCGLFAYRAALATPSPDTLDVDVLARAIWEVRAGGSIDNRHADAIATEYARLREATND